MFIMILLIPFILLVFISILAFVFLRGTPEEDNQFFLSVVTFCFLGILLLGFISLATIIWYVPVKAELRVVDEKIAVIRDMNNQRVDAVLPILNKYPELEKEIVGGINPNNFAVIGSVYPKLQSDKIYLESAEVVKSNIKKLEDLEMGKVDTKRKLYQIQMYIWFLK